MPPRSQEPDYPVHPELATLVHGWDQSVPGVFAAVCSLIGCGDWDTLGEDGATVAPYPLTKAFEAAVDQLGQTLLQQEIARQIKQGPWTVRLGLTKPSRVLPQESEKLLATARSDAQTVLAQILANASQQSQVQLTSARPWIGGWQAAPQLATVTFEPPAPR
jgi:hypothetical protein